MDSKAHKDLLRQRYDEACEDYLKAFCDAYELQYESDSWVGGEVGTTTCINDYFFDFDGVVKYAVDNGLHDYNDLVEWYDYTLFAHNFNQTIPNFKAWSKGCPRLSKSEQQKLIKLKKDFDDAVKDYKERY